MTNGMGHRIRAMRKTYGISTEKFAERLNLSISYMALIERGDRSPSLETLIKICYELNASLDYIVKGYEGTAQSKLLPVNYCDEEINDCDGDAGVEGMARQVNFEGLVSNIVMPYNYSNEEYVILLETIKHFAEQMNRVKQMKIKD